MTTTSEQYLKRQIERRDDQIRTLVTAFNAAVDENEYLASVACGFAWDLSTSEWEWVVNPKGQRIICCTYTTASMDRRWDEAVAAVEAQNAAPPPVIHL